MRTNLSKSLQISPNSTTPTTHQAKLKSNFGYNRQHHTQEHKHTHKHTLSHAHKTQTQTRTHTLSHTHTQKAQKEHPQAAPHLAARAGEGPVCDHGHRLRRCLTRGHLGRNGTAAATPAATVPAAATSAAAGATATAATTAGGASGSTHTPHKPAHRSTTQLANVIQHHERRSARARHHTQPAAPSVTATSGRTSQLIDGGPASPRSRTAAAPRT